MGFWTGAGFGVFFGFGWGHGCGGNKVWVIPKSLEGSYVREEKDGKKGW